MDLANLQNDKREFIVWLRNCEMLNKIIRINGNSLFKMDNILKKNVIIQEHEKIGNVQTYVFKFYNDSRKTHLEISSESVIKFETDRDSYILHMKDDTNLYISK